MQEWTRRKALLLGMARYAAEPQPNVLFYLLNHVRACDLAGDESTRHVPTPNLDRLAREGVRYSNAISTCPLSTPTRAMLQSGLPPEQTGAVRDSMDPKFPSGKPTLAAMFQQAGYFTSYIGVWHLAAGRAGGATGPFAEFTPPGPARLGYDDWHAFNYHTEFARGYFYRDEPRRLLLPGYETDAEAAMALEVMQQCRVSNKPFFLMVSPHPPHPPWRPNQTPAASLEKVREKLQIRPNAVPVEQDPNRDPRCYYAQLHNVDENLGRMLQYMDKNDLTNDTIVVVTSTHGEMLGSHGLWGAGSPYAECIDVPLLIRWPGHIAAGSRSDTLFTPVDFLPKLASLCGLPDAKEPPLRNEVIITNFSGNPQPPFRALRDRRHTYIRWQEKKEELYDNSADPFQLQDLTRKSTSLLRKFRARLR